MTNMRFSLCAQQRGFCSNGNLAGKSEHHKAPWKQFTLSGKKQGDIKVYDPINKREKSFS